MIKIISQWQDKIFFSIKKKFQVVLRSGGSTIILSQLGWQFKAMTWEFGAIWPKDEVLGIPGLTWWCWRSPESPFSSTRSPQCCTWPCGTRNSTHIILFLPSILVNYMASLIFIILILFLQTTFDYEREIWEVTSYQSRMLLWKDNLTKWLTFSENWQN